MIVSKAFKRLHIIRVLRRGGVSEADLLVIYVALVRSVLEYCCVVWHNALPAYLSSQIERVQMRALRIIYPRSSYQEALQRAKIARLEDRRNELCMRAFDKITKGGPLSKHLTPIRSIAMTTPLETLTLGRLSNVKPSALGEAFSLVLS